MTAIALVAVSAVGAGREAAKSLSSATETGPTSACVTRTMQEFARLELKQIETIAHDEKLTVPKEMTQLLQSAEKNDWDGIEGAWRVLARMSGQYERSTNDVSGIAATTNADFHLLWPSVLEVYGFSEQVHLWNPGMLSQYAEEMLKDLPPGAVLFGGTDPGRFVLTAYLAVQHETNRFVITQNGLTDHRYMAYVRRLYGDRMSLPVEVDSANAFQTYVEEVRSGKRPRNAQLDIKNGRVTVEGVMGVMEINGILAQMIFDRNKHDRQFFVEESYVIPWMYPFLTPHGLILRLNGEPTPLTDTMATADHEFWGNCEKKLRGQEVFSVDTSAQKTYSKLRSAIGGVYAFRGRLEDAEKAFEQARRLFPESPEANYRLVQGVLLRQNRFADALRVMNEYRDRLPKWVDICAKDGIATELQTEQGRVDGMIGQIKKFEAQQNAGKK
jgi:hypothetical protein